MITKPTKYTSEFILSELKDMLKQLEKDKEILYKGELFEQRDYSYKRFSEWAKTYENNEEISDTLHKINLILENRVVKGAMNRSLSEKMVKFHLINNFDWSDKKEIKHSGEMTIGSLLDKLKDGHNPESEQQNLAS